MTTTISVSDETKARFDDLRPAGAASNDEFLSALLEYYEDGVAPEYADTDAGIPDDLRDQLDRIEAAATTAEDRTGSIQATLEAMGGRR